MPDLFQPYEIEEPSLFQPYEPEPPSMVSQATNWIDDLWINQPLTRQFGLDLPGLARNASNIITDPGGSNWALDKLLEYSPAGMFGVSPNVQRGFLGGALEGIGGLAEGFTTPLNLATMGAGARAGQLYRTAKGLEEIGDLIGATRAAQNANRAAKITSGLSAPVIGTGAAHTYVGLEENDPIKAGMGIAEMAGGLGGVASWPMTVRPDVKAPGQNYWGVGIGDNVAGFRWNRPEPSPMRVDPSDVRTYGDLLDPEGNIISTPPAGIIPEQAGPWRTPEPPPIRPIGGVWADEVGTADFGAIWTNLKRMLGRDPSAAEIEAAMAREPRPGEPTGAVAQFDPTASIEAGIKRINDPNELRMIIRGAQGTLDRARPDSNPNELEEARASFDWATERLNELIPPQVQSPLGQVRPTDELLRQFSPTQDTRIPVRTGVEWPPKSGEIISQVQNPPIEQPNLPGLPIPIGQPPIEAFDPRQAASQAVRNWRAGQKQEPLPLSSDLPIRGEILGPEISTQRDLTDEELADIRERLARGLQASYGEDVVEGQRAYDEVTGTIPSMSVEMEGYVKNTRQALDAGYKVYPPNMKPEPGEPIAGTFEAEDGTHTVVGYRHLVSPDNPTGRYIKEPEGPQEMRVPGTKGPSGLSNVALGGADPRVWDVAGSSLYSGEREVIVAKELLQNAFDEHRSAGVSTPVRMVMNNMDKHPQTGAPSPSIAIRDNGRGLTPDQMYTVLTDLGKTGKANEPGASGGFGFAKAAPFAGGKYAKVVSTVKEGKNVVQYRFEGNPTELKNQAQGVPLHKKVVDPSTPTGLEVTTWFSDKDNKMWSVRPFIKNLVENSPSITSDLHVISGYEPEHLRNRFLKGEDINVLKNEGLTPDVYTRPTGRPTFRDKIITPGAEVSIHYNEPTGGESQAYDLSLLNKGLFQGTTRGSYGWNPVPNVPRSIVADIVATVEEGSEAYPFTANREQIDSGVKAAIDKWIQDNIISGAQRNRVAALQKYYDGIQPIPGSYTPNVSFYDEGNRFTPDEIEQFRNSTAYNNTVASLKRVNDQVLAVADGMGWTMINNPNFKPSIRLKKFGILMKGKDSKGTTYGIHIPRADDLNDSAILINLFEGLKLAQNSPNPVDRFASHMFATITHEIAHTPGGGHDEDFAYRDADLRSAIGVRTTLSLMDELAASIGDIESGTINPEILDLLSVYDGSRGRNPSSTTSLLSTGISSGRPGNTPRPEAGDVVRSIASRPESGPNIQRASQLYAAANRIGDRQAASRMKQTADQVLLDESSKITLDMLKKYGYEEFQRLIKDESGFLNIPSWKDIKRVAGWGQGRTSPAFNQAQYNWIDEILAVPKNMTTTADLSAPGRQGLALINTPQFWKAAYHMFGGLTETGFNRIDAHLRSKPLFQSTTLPNGRPGPSFADEVGLHLFSRASQPGTRAQAVASRWLEDAPVWRRTPMAAWIRASNRAYITFLNHLRANRFEYLMNRGQDISLEATQRGKARTGVMPWKQRFTQTEAMDLDPYRNLMRAREIADAVNTFTGQAPLRTHVLPLRGAEINLEGAARILGRMFFSPGLAASRLRLTNPNTYVMASPMMRKEYLKAALGVAAAWTAGLQLVKMGAGDEAEINLDPTSADFGKGRIGNFRIDPGGGVQQFLVLYARLLSGQYTSSATGQSHETGAGYQATTRGDLAQRFIANKLEPATKLGYDMAFASGYQPVPVGDRILQMYTPLIIQDMVELSKEKPDLLPAAALSFFGVGTQIYGKGQTESKFINPEDDWIFRGGQLAEGGIAPY